MPDLIEKCPSVRELQAKVVEILIQAGYIEKKLEGYVVDLEKIKNLNYNKELRNKLPAKYVQHCKNKPSFKQSIYFDRGTKETILFYAFKNLKLISKFGPYLFSGFSPPLCSTLDKNFLIVCSRPRVNSFSVDISFSKFFLSVIF